MKSREIFRNYAYRQTHKREVSTKERFQKEIERNLYGLEVTKFIRFPVVKKFISVLNREKSVSK